jgi:hypothetical protein
MTDRPILFKGEMVRAINEGRKTQTRRVVHHPPFEATDKGIDIEWAVGNLKCPYGVPGDRLWVRETWGCPSADHPCVADGRKPRPGDRLVYRANPADDYQWGAGLPSQGSFCWRPSIFMPRWASRILLEITDVRVQRVQEISEEDAIAEGVAGPFDVGYKAYRLPGDSKPRYSCAVAAYAVLWDSINAPRGYSWESNPWVWAITFRRIQ